MARAAFVTGGSGFIGGALIRRLVAEGWSVKALARSERSAEKVRERGAEPMLGDLDNFEAIGAGAGDCEVAFHAAAALGEWGRREEFERVNVAGTRNVIRACEAAGVGRFVHVGTEAAILAGEPLVDVDETAPLRPDSKSDYCATKAMAEQEVRDANKARFETVVVRPRLVWGPGDTTILPGLVEAVRKGRFAWIGGGGRRTSTTHVDNVVEGLLLGAERGRPGGVYFVTDGEPVVFREFVTELLSTQGIEARDRNAPRFVVRRAAPLLERIWRTFRLKSTRPVTRTTIWLASLET